MHTLFEIIQYVEITNVACETETLLESVEEPFIGISYYN